MANKGNFIEAEGLVKKLNEAFTDHVKVVQMSVQTVKSLNDEYKKLPSDYAKGLKDVTIAQEKAVANTNKLIEVKKQANAKTSEEIVNGRALAQSADRQTRATSALVGAYANLNAKHQQASKLLQDLIVRGRQAGQTQSQYNRELRQAQKEFNTLNQRILSADRAVGRFNRNVGNYPTQALRGIKDLIGAFGIVGGVSLFALITKDIISTGKELQGLNNALMLVTETQANFAEQQQFLQRISEAYGLEIQGLTKQFTQFYVSAKDKISGREIQDIFESVSKAGASMGLSVQSQERAFLALNQMMSKGSIQAEELRGQLGEALPGAFGIMAKAVGVTEKELGNMMKAGELLASDVLPKFARQLEITYGIENVNRIETMTTATNRLSNAWTKFVESITRNDGAISKSLIATFNVISDIVDGIRLLTMTEKERNDERKKNVVSKQIDEYKDYLSTLDLTNKVVVQQTKNLVLLDLQRNASMRKEIETLKLRRMEIIANQRTGGIGAGDKEELASIDEKLKVYPILIEKYIQQAEAFNEVMEAQNKLANSGKELTDKEIKELERLAKKREKLHEQELQRLYQLRKMRLESQKRYFDEESKDEGMYAEERISFIEDAIQKEIEVAELNRKEGLRLAKGSKTQELIVWEEYYAELEDIVRDSEARILKVRSDSYKEWEDMVDKFDGEGLRLDLFGNDPAGDFAKYREKNKENLEWTFEDWVNYGSDVVSNAQELTNTLIELDNQRFENQLNNLEKEKNNALLFAGESAEARAEIERQYEEKRARIQRKQAEAQRKQAIFNTIVNTAQAVVASLAQTPPPAGIPLALLVGAIGAAQLAVISSQQIPEFYKGTDNAPEGLAWTQEQGRELITDKFGKVKDLGSDKGAKLTPLKKGDKVYTADQTQAMMFNNELNSILLGKGINPNVVVNNDNEELKSEIRELGKIIKNKSSITVIEDKRGKRIFEKSQSSRKELVNNRIKIKGSDV